ncbi:MAG: flippase [bacterium]|nr:flippase [bacterium]
MTTAAAPLTGQEARRAARNAGAIAAARVLSSGALLLWQLILGRLLGESDFGVYGTVGALFTIGVTLTSFGMSAILIRDVARRPAEAGRYAAASLVVQTCFGVLAYLGINAAGLALGYDPAIRAYAAIAAISLFVDLAGSTAYDTLLGREKMVIASAIDVIHIMARIGFAGLALAFGFGLLGVYVVTLLAGIGRAAALWGALRRDGVRPHFPLDRTAARLLVINGAPLAFSAFINQTYVQVDKLMTTSLLTTADTGHLNAAFVILYGVVELLSTTVIVATYPLMARAFDPAVSLSDDRNAPFRVLIEKLAYYSLILVIPMGLVFTLFSTAIILPLFGDRFAATADVLRVLMWYAAVTIVVNVYAQGMIAMNHQRTLVMVRAGGLLLKLALNALLLPRVGVTGAAFASVIAEIIVLAAMLRAYQLGERLAALAPQFGRLALAAGIGAAAMIAAGSVHPLFGMAAGGMAYLGGVLALRVLLRDDWDLLYRLAEALPGGALVRRFWKRAGSEPGS